MNKMSKFQSYSRFLTWFMALMLSVLAAGCGGGGGGQDPILGIGGIAGLAPTVTAVTPVANANPVPINTKIITAAFSKAMDPATLTTASFTLACPAGTPVAGAVTYLAAGNVATLTLPAAPNLPLATVCTATVTTAAKDTTGIPLASNYVWTFTTGASADVTRPGVTLTVPATTIPGPTLAVPTNTAITAVFTEAMAPATITAAGTFTVTCAAPCVSPAGAVVIYAVGSRTAVFTPAAVLTASTTYTATITTAATDLAGNQLAGNQAPPLPAASNYVWTFTTGAGPAAAAPVSVLSTNPVSAAPAVCPNATVNATFTVPSGLRMDPLTVNAGNFIVTGPAATSVTAASVALDVPTGRIATFTPLAVLPVGGYTATIKGGATGVKDLANPANTMASDFTWTFTVVPASGACLAPIPLNSASTFGDFGGSAGMTNSGLLTVINGDIGTTAVSTAVTGFHDAGPGCTYTETGLNVGTVNGKIYTAPPPPTVACPTEGTGTAAPPVGTFGIATTARADALAAYNTLAGLAPTGPIAANLSGLTVFPGVYFSATGFLIQDGLPGPAGDLTLDAQGNANAVWVFQSASTLTVGGPGAAFPRSVKLINGAQSKNIFWQVGSSAVINAGGGGTFEGTVISSGTPPGIAVSTAGNVNIVTINGRLLSLGASVTLVDTVINVPAP